MNNKNLFDYPNNLQIIFDKISKYNIKSIIVGGYIRDKFLNLNSKDIDIELFGVSSFEKLENILNEFGEVNSVGKSFGVCKLNFEDMELDFTLPRTDNKVSSGHTGFTITIEKNIDFKTAANRRDFTINAIGFSTQDKKILDPFNGQGDIQNKILRAVNLDTFAEDPLRILRAVGFASRFNFTLEKKLFSLCKNMCNTNILNELPKERIFTEIEKILLKSPQPSDAFLLLKKLNALQYFPPLNDLNEEKFQEVLNALDRMKKQQTTNKTTNMYLMLSVLCSKFSAKQTLTFITNLTNSKTTLKNVTSLLSKNFQISYSDSDILRLACFVHIEHFLILSQALHPDIVTQSFQEIHIRAKKLGVLHKKAGALLLGRDLIAIGIEPSKEYGEILAAAYEAQLSLKIRSSKDAKEWLKTIL